MKKIFSSFLVFFFTLSFMQPTMASVSNFSDVDDGHRFFDDIHYLVDEQVIYGFPDGTFRPGDDLTRGQAAIMIGRARNLDGEKRESSFPDVAASSTASGYIESAVEEGIIQGYTDRTFRPDNPVTRGQMAMFLSRAYELDSAEINFTDVSANMKAYDAIKEMYGSNITIGYPDGTFRPKKNITRGQFSAFMYRTLEDVDVDVSNVSMEVVFFDVGQGDASFINVEGETMLIDAGTAGEGQEIVQYLDEEGMTSIDYLVSTHSHADHLGGMVPVMESIEVGEVLDQGIAHTSQTYLDYLDYIDTNDISFTVPEIGDEFSLGLADVTVVSTGLDGDDLNDGSLSLLIEFQDTSFLFTGDAEEGGEARIVDNINSDIDVLQVGHHGSNTSSSPFFLDAVTPEYAVFSYGVGNSYGHPHQEVVDRYEDRNISIYSTAEQEDIKMVAQDGNINVMSEAWDGSGLDVEEPAEPVIAYPININTNGHELLQEITGVGSYIAQNIIDYRDTHGAFTAIEQITNVSGIGDARFETMKQEITVGG